MWFEVNAPLKDSSKEDAPKPTMFGPVTNLNKGLKRWGDPLGNITVGGKIRCYTQVCRPLIP